MFVHSDGQVKIFIVVWNLFSRLEEETEEGRKWELIWSKIDLASLCNFPIMSSLLWLLSGWNGKRCGDFRLNRLQSNTNTFLVFLLHICLHLALNFSNTRKLSQSVNLFVSFFRIYLCSEWPHRCLHLCSPDDPVTWATSINSITEERFLYLACFSQRYLWFSRLLCHSYVYLGQKLIE